jgi:glycosyltransferase involved in cell wall biosynthesis
MSFIFNLDIAVIIPLFNGAQWINQTLKSVVRQSLLPAEIIVIDDGSKDMGPEIARSFQGVKLIHNPGKGADQARNFGFVSSRANFVAFIDQDDILHPDHFEVLGSIFKKRSNKCPAVISNVCYFKREDRLIFKTPVINPVEYDVWNYFPSNRISTLGAGLVRREAINSLGGWPTQFGPASDVNFWFRLSANQPLVLNRSITVAQRLHDSSWSCGARTDINYFDLYVEALKHAYTDKLSKKLGDVNLIENFIPILENMRGVISSVKNHNAKLLRNSALALEDLLLPKSDRDLNYTCQVLLWFTFSTLSSGEIKRSDRELLFLTETWPKEACRTRKSILFIVEGVLLIWETLRILDQLPAKLRNFFVLSILFPLLRAFDDKQIVFFQ